MTGAQPARRRGLGMWMATALVVGNMIGSGVFLLPSALAAYGPISVVAFGLTGIGAILLALVFARLGSAYPHTGGPYAYSRRAFGDFMGFWTAWGYWIAIWAGNAAIAIAFVGYLGVFWPGATGTAAVSALVALGAIWTLTLVNILGIRQGGWVQLITTILKILPLFAVAVIGLFFINSANFSPFNASGGSAIGAITAAAALTLWAFIGLESSTVPAEDVENPRKTIPRSTIIGTVLVTAVYVLSTVAVMGVMGTHTLAASTAPYSDAANQLFGGSLAGKLVALGAIISTFGCLNGWILLQGQVPRAAARDGLFPRQFNLLSKNGTPWFGLVISSVLITALMAMNYTESLVTQFTFVILLATLTTLVPYAFSAMAQLMLFITDRQQFVGARFIRDSIIAVLAFAYSVWAIWGAGSDIVFKGFILLMAGIPVYVWIKWRAARKASAAVTPVTALPSAASPAAPDVDRPAAA